MAWHVQCPAGHVAHLDGLIFSKQVVELRAVGLETGLQVEDALEHLLHFGDVATDGGFAA